MITNQKPGEFESDLVWVCISSPCIYEGRWKVRSLTQLTTRYAHYILSLLDIVMPCNTNTNGKYGGWRSSSKRHFLWQPVIELTCEQLRCPGSKWLVCFLNWKNSWKETNFWWRGRYLHGKWLAGRLRTTIFLQWNQSIGEMLDQVHFSCRRLCWQVTKYNVRISNQLMITGKHAISLEKIPLKILFVFNFDQRYVTMKTVETTF